MTNWKTGDQVIIECDGRSVAATISLASRNSVSLVLEFDAMLAGHLGTMFVLRHEDGVYRSIVNDTPVTLSRTQ